MTSRLMLLVPSGRFALPPTPDVLELMDDTDFGAAWTEVAGPHAYYDAGRTYIAAVRGNDNPNDISVWAYVHATTAIEGPVLLRDALDGGATTTPDSHLGPAVIVLPSGKIVAAYCGHQASTMFLKVSDGVSGATWHTDGFSPPISLTPTAGTYTYPCLAYTSANNRVWLFYRYLDGGNTGIARARSDDGGLTWFGGTKMFQTTDSLTYFAFASNGVDRVDFAVTDGPPDQVGGYGLWHFYMDETGDVFRSDGTEITPFTYPLATTDLTEIVATSGGDRYPYSMSYTADERPVIAVQSKAAGTVHIGEYRWDGAAWDAHTIDTSSPISGSILSVGGGAHDWNNANRFVSAKMVTGSLEMMLYTSSNDGVSWTGTQLTSPGTGPNSPVYVANAGGGLAFLWFGELFDSDDFDCTLEGLA